MSVATDNLFDQSMHEHGLGHLAARGVSTLQVNLGKRCNQACRHCHVDAGPHQTGAAVNMNAEVAAQVLTALRDDRITTLDLTGGAPELNPNFCDLVRGARGLGVHVIDRCNLTVLFEPGQERLGEFLAEHQVEVIASLPHYRPGPADRQRGEGVFQLSIDGLRRLNELGYGRDHARVLNLVHNPAGSYLPGDQCQLEVDYRGELLARYGVVFNQLYTITNMPIARFDTWLHRTEQADSYTERLRAAFNPAAAAGVMCRDLVSVGSDGRLYDCDFNQMLSIPVTTDSASQIGAMDLAALSQRRIATGDHCLGCTAGAGSSCGGTTA